MIPSAHACCPQIHSATVCIGLEDLQALTRQRYKVLQALERAIIRKEVSDRVIVVWHAPVPSPTHSRSLCLPQI